MKPSAVLYVVAPSYLGFVVLPNKKWVLETEIEYTIVIEVFDKNSHKIYPSDVGSSGRKGGGGYSYSVIKFMRLVIWLPIINHQSKSTNLYFTSLQVLIGMRTEQNIFCWQIKTRLAGLFSI